jgi:hypothetical protein
MSTPETGTVNYICYNPERTDYTITDDEFTRLQDASDNQRKDVCLVTLAIGLPCMINAIHDTANPFVFDLSLFLNYIFGILGLGLALIYGIQWYRTRKKFNDIVSAIKQKPKMKIGFTSNQGEIFILGAQSASQAQPPTT